MSSGAFTLILTKGTHSVCAEAAAAIIRAIENRDPTVEIEFDLFGAGDAPRKVTLATAHVVALCRNAASESSLAAMEGCGPAVAVLRPRASPRQAVVSAAIAKR